jgi:hypothetical protein
MKNDKQTLMKHFASVMRKRANAPEEDHREVSPSLVQHLSRKELIEIIESMDRVSIAKDIHMVELENEELLKVIGDDMLIISYVTGKWCAPQPQNVEAESKPKPKVIPSVKKTPKDGK